MDLTAGCQVGKWHQGQRPAYLPNQRGFSEYYGLPFSVDDGTGFASSCAPPPQAPASGATSALGSSEAAAPAGFTYIHRPPVSLGPQLPLPLVRQQGNESVIVNQPTDLVPLSSNYATFLRNFTRRHIADPMLLYVSAPIPVTLTASRNCTHGCCVTTPTPMPGCCMP
jgi:hypothetical protein